MAPDRPGFDAQKRGTGKVVRPDWFGDDPALVAAMQANRVGAAEALFVRYATHVQRVLVRILGPDDELADLLHDVFITALGELPKLRDASRLKAWLSQIAVHKARGLIRRRRRRSWLRFVSDVPEVQAHGASSEVSATARAAMGVLERMPADLRIPFALRFIDDMELSDVAECCDCSLATIKRRLARAEERFRALSKADPNLRAALAESARWSQP